MNWIAEGSVDYVIFDYPDVFEGIRVVPGMSAAVIKEYSDSFLISLQGKTFKIPKKVVHKASKES